MKLTVLIPLLGLTACASMFDGDTQPVTVKAVPEVGATCTLKNGQGEYAVSQTSATVTVISPLPI
jgi:ABC-type enterochelin transport system substrate-binding protein